MSDCVDGIAALDAYRMGLQQTNEYEFRYLFPFQYIDEDRTKMESLLTKRLFRLIFIFIFINAGAFEGVSLFMTVLIVVIALKDGISNWLIGLVLILSYAFLGAAFWLHSPEESM